ncbi:MAG: tyrosine-protein phosphatase [Prevotella sp.]|nr:tyrosine-protein phosphatase [Prevotella sp.]
MLDRLLRHARPQRQSRQRYGSLSAYIENQLGFSKEEQQQLRAKYLTN